MNLNKIHQSVSQFLPQINQILVKEFFRGVKVKQKGGIQPSVSVVTKVDQKLEKILKNKLKKILPVAGFIGEETEIDSKKELNWVVDPIDGTLNFASRIPVFAVSIALWQGNEPIYALVSLPLQQETIHGFKGKGVFVNGKKLRIKTKKLIKPLVTYSYVGTKELLQKLLWQLTLVFQAVRGYGSCVFHGVNIALQRFTGGIFINQAIWDIGAIILLAQEAGLAVKYISAPPNIRADDLKNYQYSLVIGPDHLVEKLCVLLQKN